MKRVAALYDVHGNIFALDAVLRDLEGEGVDAVVIGGDVTYGPFVRDVLDRLLALGSRAVWLRGNADRELVEFVEGTLGNVPSEVRAALAWDAERITRTHLDFLARLPHRVSLHVGTLGEVLFCHGSPRRDDEIITRITPPHRLAALVQGVTEETVVCGHTHVPFDRRVGGRRVVNAGSVGLAYGEAVASWLLLGDAPNGVAWRRTSYDHAAAVRAIRESGHPSASEFEEAITRPPSAEEASAYFEARATS